MASTKRSNEFILAICIPTYNNRQMVVAHIKSLLAIDDGRFCIRINDNHSTDGLIDDISNIHDNRLLYHAEEWNKGSGINTISSVAYAPAKYSLLCIDKNVINPSELSNFIAYLEAKNPYYGYVSGGEVFHEERMLEGIDSVLASAYESKHPTGWFFRTDLFNDELQNRWFAITDKTEGFIMDMFAASLGCRYSYSIVNMPILPSVYSHKTQSKTKSFNEHNAYFGYNGRLKTVLQYNQQLEQLPLSDNDKKVILEHVIKRYVWYVSRFLRELYFNENLRESYGLTNRKITLYEMCNNTYRFLSTIKSDTKIVLSRKFYIKMYIMSVLRNIRYVCRKK